MTCMARRKKKSSAAALLGAAGGKAGRGKRKARGDAEYYRQLVAKRRDRVPT